MRKHNILFHTRLLFFILKKVLDSRISTRQLSNKFNEIIRYFISVSVSIIMTKVELLEHHYYDSNQTLSNLHFPLHKKLTCYAKPHHIHLLDLKKPQHYFKSIIALRNRTKFLYNPLLINQMKQALSQFLVTKQTTVQCDEFHE